MRAAASGLSPLAATCARACACHPTLVGSTGAATLALPASDSSAASEVGVLPSRAHEAVIMMMDARAAALPNELRDIRTILQGRWEVQSSTAVAGPSPLVTQNGQELAHPHECRSWS